MKMLYSFGRFFKYLKWCTRGGYTECHLSQIQYPEILEGKRIIITGGSDGIGLCMAKKFVSAGAEVLITGRRMDKLRSASAVISSSRIHILQWDVCDLKSLDKNLSAAVAELGGVNCFVNNAAFLSENYEVTEDFFDRTIDTNVKAVWFLCQKVSEFMRKENGVSGGKILNISSVSSFEGDVDPYFLSKRAVNAITEGFAKKYAPYNIIVNAIAPGYCDSAFNKVNYAENAYREEPSNKRIIIPEEIAELAAFLISDASNGIVGQTILCDGGSLL